MYFKRAPGEGDAGDGSDSGRPSSASHGTSAGEDGDEGGSDAALKMVETLEHGGLSRKRGRAESDEDAMDDSVLLGLEEIGMAPRLGRGRGRGRGRGGRGRRKRTPRSGKRDEAYRLMGQANNFFADGDYEKALEYAKHVIRLQPSSPEAYNLMGTVHESRGDSHRALRFFILEATIKKKDVDRWLQLATRCEEEGMIGDAIGCLSEVLRRRHEDADARSRRAALFVMSGEVKKGANDMEKLVKQFPEDSEYPKELAKIYYQMDKPDKAASVLEAHLSSQAGDLTMVNMLAQLLMEQGRFSNARDLIEGTGRELCGMGMLPIDLKVKAGICAAYLEDSEGAGRHLHALLREPVDGLDDLLLEAADAMMSAAGNHAFARDLYSRLLSVREHNTAVLWTKLAQCYRALLEGTVPADNQLFAAAVETFEGILQSLPPEHADIVEAKLFLAEMLARRGSSGDDESIKRAAELVTDAVFMEFDEERQASDRNAPEQRRLLLQFAVVLRLLDNQQLLLDVLIGAVQESLQTLCANATLTSPLSHVDLGLPDDIPAAVESALRRRLRMMKNGQWRHFPDEVLRQLVDAGVELPGYQGPRMQSTAHAAVFKRDREGVAARRDRRSANVAEADRLIVGLLRSNPTGWTALVDANDGSEALNVIATPEDFELLMACIAALIDLDETGRASKLLDDALKASAKKRASQEFRDRLRFARVCIDVQRGDVVRAHRGLKQLVARWPEATALWNVHSEVIHASLRAAIGKFSPPANSVLRSTKLVSVSRSVGASSPFSSLQSGHHRTYVDLRPAVPHALAEYLQARRGGLQHEPLCRLCVGTAFCTWTAARVACKRHAASMQGLSELSTHSSTQRSPQGAFNLGRGMHQLGLNFLAAEMYQHTLACVVAGEGTSRTDMSSAPTGAPLNAFTNATEAAFNLSVILLQAGSEQAARSLMRQRLRF